MLPIDTDVCKRNRKNDKKSHFLRVMKKAMLYWLDIKKHIQPEFLFLLTSGLLTDPEKLKKLEQKYNPPPLLEILNEELE